MKIRIQRRDISTVYGCHGAFCIRNNIIAEKKYTIMEQNCITNYHNTWKLVKIQKKLSKNLKNFTLIHYNNLIEYLWSASYKNEESIEY